MKHREKSSSTNRGKVKCSSSESLSSEMSSWVAKYSEVASRLSKESSSSIGLEELDALQLDLESLLASVVMRRRDHEADLDEMKKSPANWQANNLLSRAAAQGVKRGPSSPTRQLGGGGKRFKSGNSLSVKPSLGSSVEGSRGGGNASKALNKALASPTFDPLENEQVQPLSEGLKPSPGPKNETPARFWAFVEPYCANITTEDVKMLEDLIKAQSETSEFMRIPPLGEHYTVKWAREDVEAERVKGSIKNEPDSGSVDRVINETKEGLNQNENSSPFGELTQRLVCGLMEEGLINQSDSVDQNSAVEGAKNGNGDRSNLISSLNVTNAESLEQRVRRELEEQGILEPEGSENTHIESQTDEVLEELQRCQAELKSVSAHNMRQLQHLFKSAKEELMRQEVRQRLQMVDAEVIQAYQRVSLARSKKKSLSKKDRDQAWKCLKERELIIRELEIKHFKN